MILDELVAYIDAQVAALTTGTNLFAARMPDSPDTAVAVAATPGAPPIQTFGRTLAMTRPRVQITCRGSVAQGGYSAAHTNATTIWNLFKAFVSGTALSGVIYQSISPLQDPFLLMRDALDRPIIAFNLEIYKDFS